MAAIGDILRHDPARSVANLVLVFLFEEGRIL